ncbi:unnamed protein product [Moneuplotes crassus]|uniref:RING-type domain-containing protein n=1 Tax=Euplotes crassus TaxID=5936 RepID=A0AAD1XUV1_EUPCR|nr:unnamed protein product [Moneuplotes crassus]
MCNQSPSVIGILMFAFIFQQLFQGDYEQTRTFVLFWPSAMIIYMLFHIGYSILKKYLGVSAYLLFIATGYLLVAGLFFNFTMANEYMDDKNESTYFWIVEGLSLVVSIRFIYLVLRKCTGNRVNELDTNLEVDERNYFEQIPYIIYQPFTSLKSDECSICLTKYEQDDTIKVMPVCFHTFHSQCIREWLENNSTCPFCRREFTQSEIQKAERMNEQEIYESIKVSDIRPSIFSKPERKDPRDSLNIPYDPNYKG